MTWCVRERPWEVESQVTALMEPPLNSAGNSAHRFYARLSSARALSFAAASGDPASGTLAQATPPCG
jgi:hypothetical protein